MYRNEKAEEENHFKALLKIAQQSTMIVIYLYHWPLEDGEENPFSKVQFKSFSPKVFASPGLDVTSLSLFASHLPDSDTETSY